MRRNFIYARVLQKQLDLSGKLRSAGKTACIRSVHRLTDVVPGINLKERLQTISAIRNCRRRLSPTETDLQVRLRSRRGSRLPAGGRVIVIADSDTATEQRGSSEQELAEDLLSSLSMSPARQMGKRKYTSDSKRDGDETAKKSKTAVEAHCRAAEDSGELAAHGRYVYNKAVDRINDPACRRKDRGARSACQTLRAREMESMPS
jgi:predicted site-specific integrase-resolvase